ncbi:MAG TPA: glycoside hydrolase family 16 protein [Terriglobia bacterium]|nr:glycoside hydrolase family 16 protein [Terriglobia bacterium]
MGRKSGSWDPYFKSLVSAGLIFLTASLLGAGFSAKLAAQRRSRRLEPRWKLVWSDEFDGPDGSAPDTAWWTYDVGVGGDGWGNRELEYYTKRPDNISIQGGNLVITARRETFSGPADPGSARQPASGDVTRQYTSARIKTQGLFSQAYGRFEARIRVPSGQGMWPAFWMLGADIDKVHWPGCGEIDVMENIGKEPSTVHGSLHGPGPRGAGTDDMTAGFTLPHGQRFSDGFHVFGIEWQPGEIDFYVDNTRYFTAAPRGMPHGTGWVFDHPFFLLLNLAVGGSWPGNPDSSTQFPQQMLVDYVRVYAPAHPLAAVNRIDGDRWLDARSLLSPLLTRR